MAWFKDFDRLTPFIAAFRPMLTRQLDSHMNDVEREMIKNWEQGQDAMGRAWEPNAPSTLAQKDGSTPLIETRQMIESVEVKTNEDDLTAVISIADEEGKVLAHEYGVPEKNIPPRPILGPTAELVEQEADSLLRQAFQRTWATATVSGTSVGLGVGSRGRR